MDFDQQTENVALVQKVLDFDPLNLESGQNFYECPLLLSVLCSLVKNKSIKLSDEQTHPGEIFSKITLCLYKYYMRTRGIDSSHDAECTQQVGSQDTVILTKLDPLALNMLSDTSSAKKSEVTTDIGKEAFDLGLLIGKEGYFNLDENNSSDISLSFLHITFKLFFAAFFFQMLSDERNVDHLLRNFERLSAKEEKLFLEFCFWFLLERSKYFSHEGNGSDCQKLIKKFFETFLAGCDPRVPAIFNSITEQIKTTSKRMYPLLEMHTKGTLNVISLNKSKMIISIGNYADMDTVHLFLENCKSLRENPFIHLYVANGSELARLLQEDLTKVQISFYGSDSMDMLASANRIPFCQNLTDLSIIGKVISYRTVRALSNAVAKQNLPHLTHLSLINCQGTSKESGKPKSTLHLSELFRQQWPNLSHLNLYESSLATDDIMSLFAIPTHQGQTKLPNLRSIVLSAFRVLNDNVAPLWEQPLTNITSLFLDGPLGTIHKQFNSALADNKLPSLTNLAIQVREFGDRLSVVDLKLENLELLESLALHNFIDGKDNLYCLGQKVSNSVPRMRYLDISQSKGITGMLSGFLGNNFRSLETLFLSNCELNSQDLSSLAKANVEGRLPELNHLDVSHNGNVHKGNEDGGLKHLFSGSCEWNGLIFFNITGTRDRPNFYESFSEIVGSDRLQSLEEFSFPIDYFLGIGYCMKNIRTLHILVHNEKRINVISKEIKDGLLPFLQAVCVRFAGGSPGTKTKLFQIDGVRKVTELNVSCHLAVTPEPPFPSFRCQCENSIS